jgi:hypothetical protein
MRKGFVLVLVFVFLIASCLIVSKPVSGASAVGNSWTEMAPMQVARADLGVAAVNGKIYAIGGANETLQMVSIPNYTGANPVGINEQYDPATDNWTFKAPMPDPRLGFAVATYQGKIYCIGGLGSTNSTEVYDPATNTWENKAAIPISLWPLKASVENNKIYVVGGTIDTFYNEVYDPSTDTWTANSPIPEGGAFWGVVPATSNGKIYALGGFNILSGGEPYEIYDTHTGSWSEGTPPPLGVASGGAVATTGVLAPERIYLIGAQGGLADLNTPPFPTQIYNPSTDSWTLGASMPTGRTDFGMVNLNDTIYVIGGYTYTLSPWVSMGIYGGTIIGGPMVPTAVNEQYVPNGYGTPDPAYALEHIPPKITVISPANVTYNESSISLTFSVDKSLNWSAYSLDTQQNITIIGNQTIGNLTNGLHSLTLYANDTYGNTGASETINFTIALPKAESFSTATVAAVSVAVTVVTVAGVVVYLKKHIGQ